MRVLTINHWGRGGAWPERRAALRDGIADLRPDLIAFQEADKTEDEDTVADLVEPG